MGLLEQLTGGVATAVADEPVQRSGGTLLLRLLGEEPAPRAESRVRKNRSAGQMYADAGLTPPGMKPGVAMGDYEASPSASLGEQISSGGNLAVQNFGAGYTSAPKLMARAQAAFEDFVNAAMPDVMTGDEVFHAAFAEPKKQPELKDYWLYAKARQFDNWVAEKFPVDEETRGKFVTELLGGAGSMAAFLAGGATLRAVGLMPTVAVGLMGAGQEGSAQYEAAKRAGATEADARAAMDWGSLVGVSEIAGEPLAALRVLRKFDDVSKGALKAIVKSGGIEYFQESVQRIGSNKVAQIYDENRELFDGVIQAGAIGGILGTIAQGFAQGVKAVAQSRTTDATGYEQAPAVVERLTLTDTGPETVEGAAQTVATLSPTAQAAIVPPVAPVAPVNEKLAALADKPTVSQREFTKATGLTRQDVKPHLTGTQRKALADAEKLKQQEIADAEIKTPEALPAQAAEKVSQTKEGERDIVLDLLAKIGGRGAVPDVVPVRTPDGRTATERTITVEHGQLNGGKPTLIPTIVNGQQLSNKDSVRFAIESGLEYPSFATNAEAETFAKRRSQEGGAGKAGFLGKAKAEEGKGDVVLESSSELERDPSRLEEYLASIETPPVGDVLEPSQGAQTAPTAPSEPTSLKNAVMEEERAARGRDPMGTGRGMTFEEALSVGREQLERNPQAGNFLVQTVKENLRTLDNREGPLLLVHKRETMNQYSRVLAEIEEAQNSGDYEKTALLAAEERAIDGHLNDIDEISKADGVSWSDSGRIRQMMIAEDFTLATIVRKMRAATGRALTPEELSAVAKDVKNVADAERLYTEAEVSEQVEAAKAATKAGMAEISATSAPPKKRSTRYNAARAELDAALKEFTALATGGSLFANPLPAVASLGKVAVAFIKLNGARFADFVALIRQNIGDEGFLKVKDAAEQAWSTAIETARPQARGNLKKPAALSNYARELARFFVATGTTDEDVLINQIHGELAKVVPGITKEQSRDAFNRYGQYKQLDKDELETEVRILKGQSLQVSKLRDMQAGKAPLATGHERQMPSDKERRLTKQVNELKKKGGFVVADPEKALKSAINSIETRLTNEIADLEEQIAKQERTIKVKTDPLVGAEPEARQKIEALRKQVSTLREQLDAIAPRPGMTDEQRASIAIKAAERSHDEFQRRIDAGEFGPRPKKPGAPETAGLKAARAKRDAKKAEFEHLKDLANPKKTPDERATAALDASLKRRLAENLERLATGNFEPKARRVTKPSKDTERLRFELEQAKTAVKNRIEKARLATRTLTRKVFDTAADIVFNVTRALMFGIEFSFVGIQGGAYAFGHPIKASQAFTEALRAWSTEAGASKAAHALTQRTHFKDGLYKRSRLEFTDAHGHLPAQEEVVMSSLADRIPVLKRFSRSWVTYMNRVRADWFDMMIKLGHNGTVSDAEAKVIANAVNIATGRGNFGKFNGAITLANAVFLAPKYTISRFQLLLGSPLWRGNQTTRTAIAKEYGRTLAGLGATMGLASMALYAFYGAPGEDKEWNINWNPLDKDFGLRIGQRRIDPFFGLRQTTMFVGRSAAILSGNAKAADIKNPGYTLATFFRNKLAPIPSAIASRYVGTTPESRPGHRVRATPENLAKTLITPVTYKDIYESMTREGVPAEQALGLLNILGIGVRAEPDKAKRIVFKDAA